MDNIAITDMIVHKLATPGPNARAIAERALNPAVNKLIRYPGIPFGKVAVELNLESGVSSYEIGKSGSGGILDRYPECRSVQEVWRTDTSNWEIYMRGVGKFNRAARGSTNTGAPQIATIHSERPIMEFFPNPDSNYPVWMYIRKGGTVWSDVPEEYHDLLVIQAAVLLSSPKSRNYPELKDELKENINLVQTESQTRWEGDNVHPTYTFGRGRRGRRNVDSGDPLGMRR